MEYENVSYFRKRFVSKLRVGEGEGGSRSNFRKTFCDAVTNKFNEYLKRSHSGR